MGRGAVPLPSAAFAVPPVVPRGILDAMLTQTTIAPPGWVQAQEPADWLTENERAVFVSWRSDKRRAEWLAGRLAAKRLLRESYGLPPLLCVIGREGPAPCILSPDLTAHPWVRLRLSLSHSAGLGAATVSDPDREGTAGVDVQRVRPVHPGLGLRAFTPGERAQIGSRFGDGNDPDGLLLLWALKEAAIKARRAAWGRALREIEVRLSGPSTATIHISGEPALTAAYARLGDTTDAWWLARAVRPVAE